MVEGTTEAPQEDLTDRQEQILAVILEHLTARGYPPSVREIGDAVGLRSPSSVHAQLATLEEKGYLRRDPSKPRALEVHGRRRLAATDDGVAAAPAGHDGTDRGVRRVPLLGEIAAGGPIVAEEQVEDVLALPEDWVGDGTLFALRVRGESMLEAGVLPGDVVVVRQQPTVEQGEMCAFLVDGEATVKFYRRDGDGNVWLDPANEAYEPILVPRDGDGATHTRIMGRVVSVFRSVR